MATTTRLAEPVLPGESLPLDITVTDRATGAAVDLTGATVEATAYVGTTSEALSVAQTSTNVWQAMVGPAVTLAARGRQVKVWAWVTPAASIEVTAVEVTFLVKP